MEVTLKLRNKIKEKYEKKKIENREEEERKVFKKSFTKSKNKIGLPVQFEDSRAKIDAQVRHKPLIARGFIPNILSEISYSDLLISSSSQKD